MNSVFVDKLSILIVDDEPGALDALGDIFEDQNCSVTKASTGRAAREAIRSHTFDVALLDIRLPDVRGTDLLREIRAASDSTRCIMVTASAEAEDAISALNDGASAYVTKPINVPEMMDKIQEAVAKYRKTVEDRRRLRELDVVKSVGDVAMDLDLDRLLDSVLQATVDGFEAGVGAIFLLQSDARTLQGATQIGFSDRPITEYRVSMGEGFTGRVAAQDRVLSIEDLYTIGFEVPTQLADSGVISVIGAPIKAPLGLVGVILLGWRTPRAFTTGDHHLISVLAQRIGLAITNARLFAQEDASKKRAEYLARVSQDLNSRIENEKAIVDRVTRLATERLGDGCAIFLIRPGSDALEGVRSFHRNPSKQTLMEEQLRARPVRLGEGNVGRVAETGQTIVSGPEAIAAYPERPYLADVGIRSTIALPLRAHGDVFGVMSVSITDSDRAYTYADLRLAEEFAGRASVAIENARLLRESQNKQADLQSLYQMTRVVTSSLREHEVLESLLRGTASLLGTPIAFIATVNPDRGVPQVNKQTGLTQADASEVATVCLRPWREEMLEGEEPFFIEDLQAADDPGVVECAQRHNLRSLISVPFEVDGQQEGTLVALTHRVHTLSARRRQLLIAIGALAGVAITNARSFDRERRIAARLQEWILSTEVDVDLGSIEVATDYHAALNEATVGGDFFDVFNAGPDLVGIVIGDVSGKGLEAALHIQAVKHTLRAYALSEATDRSGPVPPRDVLARTNDAICYMLPNDVFITLFYGVVNVRDCTLRYANAGHDAPILFRADESVEMLESTGRALGLLRNAVYEDVSQPLATGDTLLLYTDGVTEARRDGRFLETEGVISLLRNHVHESADEIVRGIYDDTAAYAGGSLHDDIALLALRVFCDNHAKKP